MTSDLTRRATYELARVRHRVRRRPRRGGPVVVFSMAKTGSSAVVAALRAAGVDDVHHVHDLDPVFLAREEEEYRWSGRPWRIWDAQSLLRRPRTTERPWRVVSITRDPIEQTVSAFFQPGVRRGYVHADATVGELLARFAGRLDHLPVRWFDTHVLPALGIDVYSTPFDPLVGHRVLSAPGLDLLLLRQEDLATVAPAALARLLGHDRPIAVPLVNVAAEKEHAGLYAEFRAALHPSPAAVDLAYSSRYVQHFYAEHEIERFRSRWGVGTAGGTPL